MKKSKSLACPVCHAPADQPPPEFCDTCGWELHTDISLVPSLELSDDVIRVYEKKLAVARRHWQEREEIKAAALAEKKEMEERLRRMEALQEKMMAMMETVTAGKEAEKAEKPASEKPAPVPEKSKAATSKPAKGPAPGTLKNGPLGMKFAWIPPGEFMMGSPPDEPERSDNETLHRVVLTSGFWMQTTQVTQKQWEAVMGDNPSHFKEGGQDCPVENVSWIYIQDFLLKLNRQENGAFRLPTEAEWEYACRAGTTTPSCYGYCLSTDQANYDGNRPLKGCPTGESRGKTIPVGSLKAPNDWGLHDMHGNVWEWCADWYDKGYYRESPLEDPTGPSSGGSRVLRGGSWYYFGYLCRAAYRNHYSPDNRDDEVGFRLVVPAAQF